MGHSGDDDPSDDPGDDSGLSTQYLGGLVAGALHQPDPVFPSTLLDIFSLSLSLCVCVCLDVLVEWCVQFYSMKEKTNKQKRTEQNKKNKKEGRRKQDSSYQQTH